MANNVLSTVLDFLDKKKVPYEVIRHKEVYLSADLAKACKVKEQEVAKVLLLTSNKGKSFAAILPADLMAKIKKVRAHVGAKDLTLMSEREMKSKTGCPPGAVPALTGLFGVKAYIDPVLLKSKKVVFRAGTYTDSVKMDMTDYVSLASPEEVSFSVKPSKKKPKKKSVKKKTAKKKQLKKRKK